MSSGESVLRFPGNLAADIEGRLAVADTGNHRILIGHMVGDALAVQRVVGGPEPGHADGSLEEATFHAPGGIALSGDVLIVADRGNHAVRVVDLGRGRVATMAGSGEGDGEPDAAGDPMATAIGSPGDVLLHERALYVAGADRIWRLDLEAGRLDPHAGAGGTALATDGGRLFLADPGTSTVRGIAFESGGEVETLVGADGEEAPLADCAGLAWGYGDHRLWIADTGNGRLRTLDPGTGRVDTVEPFEAELDAPSGLASAGHYTYVADANHHRILRVDQIDKRVVELAIEMP